MNMVVIDGHPAPGRLTSALMDDYCAHIPTGSELSRFAVRDMAFDHNPAQGYVSAQGWEPGLQSLAAAIAAADHLVIGFPLWWGAEPVIVKGLLDRLLVPGWAFRYHQKDPMWDRLLAGRSADLFVTMDTPPWYLRLVYGDPVMNRWKKQVLGFVGFKPVRVFRFGMTRRGGAAKNLALWQAQLAAAAASAAGLKRGDKAPTMTLRFDQRAALYEPRACSGGINRLETP